MILYNNQIIKQVAKVMSCLQEYIQKMSTVPNDVNRYLRLIRILDKRVQALQVSLQAQQKKFDLKMKELKEKKITEIPSQIKTEYQSIVQKQKQLYGYAKEKEDIASQLMETVSEHYQAIRTDLKKKIKQRPPEEQSMNISKKKKKTMEPTKMPTKQEQFLYDANDVKYCYCNGGSFGEMVGCQNPYCQKEWFHFSCIQEKNRPGDGEWFCNDCLKLRDKYKKTSLREFI